MKRGWAAAVVLLLAGAPDEPGYERAPVRYSASRPTDAIADLDARLEAGKAELRHDRGYGWLKSVLEQAGIPLSSQMLVFSKTSFQHHKITPLYPRAVYFNDDVYIGWVRGADVLEVSAVDPQLGAVFYTLDQQPAGKPRFARQTHACLQCHDSASLTGGVPGHVVRSVYPLGDGHPRYDLGTFRTDFRSAYADRWGGWYVTGDAGAMRHLGNLRVPRDGPPDLDRLREQGANLDTLAGKVEIEDYPAPTSDVVALMVLEHQAHVHNLITRANHESRLALLQSAELNRLSGKPGPALTEGGRARLRGACDPLVDGLFFVGEPALPSPVKGNSTFAADFARRGPFDAKGRSLRDFDLKTRLFRHPLSYLVYSKAYAGLPKEAREYLGERIRDVLTGRDQRQQFEHLKDADRAAVLEILNATKS